MKPATRNWPVSKFIVLWGLAVPPAFAVIFTVLFCFACWLGDGTLASLYTVDYFMPMPFYILAIWMWTLLVFVPTGIVVGACSGLVVKWRRTRSTEQEDGAATQESAPEGAAP